MTYLKVSVPATGHGGPQTRIDRIVIHGTVGPTAAGHSAGIAKYLNTIGLSAHKIVDPTTCTTMLPDSIIGYHDGHNTNEIGVEFCDPQAGSQFRWADPAHKAMLLIGAVEVRGACQRNGVPMERIRADLHGKRGICGHVDITNTPGFGNTTHQDPDVAGPFPWDDFIALVNSPTQEADMPTAEEVAAAVWKTPIAYATGPVAALQELAQLRYKIAAEGTSPAELEAAIAAQASTLAPQIAAAIKAELGGTTDAAAIEAAVRKVLTEGTGGTP